jgi:hypothetical protein
LGREQVDNRVSVDTHGGKANLARFELIDALGLQT